MWFTDGQLIIPHCRLLWQSEEASGIFRWCSEERVFVNMGADFAKSHWSLLIEWYFCNLFVVRINLDIDFAKCHWSLLMLMIMLHYAKDSICMCVIMIVGMDGEGDEDGDGTGVWNGQINSSNSARILDKTSWFCNIWKIILCLFRLGSQLIVPH